MTSKVASWIVDYRLTAALTVLMVVMISAGGGAKLQLDNTYRAQFDSDNPHLLAYESLEIEYASEDSIYIAVAPGQGTVFQPRVLDLIEQLTEQSWLIPYSRRVDSLTNFQYLYSRGDDLIVAPLFKDAQSLTTEAIAVRRAAALAETTLNNALVVETGAAAGINITMNLPGQDRRREVLEVTDYVRGMLAEFQRRYPDIHFYLTGKTVQDRAYVDAGKADSTILFPVMFVLNLVVLYLALRSIVLVALTLLTLLLAVGGAAGVIGWSGVPYTVEGTIALMMVIPIAVADSVHLLVNYVQRLHDEPTPTTAMVASLRINLKPILVTSVTTAVGFLSLNLVEAPPLRLIGNTVAIGVAFAFFIALLVLPALVLWLPARAIWTPAGQNWCMPHLADWVIRRHRPLFLAMAIGMLAAASGLPFNALDQVSSEYYDESVRYRQDSEWINAHLTGIERLNYILHTGPMAASVTDPEYLDDVGRFAEWLRQQPEVVSVNALSDVMKRLNKNMHGDAEEWYRLPESREMAAQYLLVYEQSLPYGLDLTNQINFRKSASRVAVILTKMSNREIIAFDRTVQAWLRDNTLESIGTGGVGPSAMFAYQIDYNMRGLLSGILFTFVMVSIILLFVLRSWRLGLISLIPNLAPAAMAFGLWGFFHGEVGMIIFVAMAITLGIVVDDSVHFLIKYHDAKARRGLNVPDAVRYAFDTVGFACLTTTLSLGLGFTVLVLSVFTPHSNMGIVCSLTIILAWIIDFFFLPPLLLRTERL
uniref:SSD domain-containing protein n=1 Tax=Candidatus Kentrum sp. LFY TaxID=2126342 RepID=A0A450WKU7_9GAMM|nr:MAG: hypothetical protein BECKLFY1418C_GA0070996_10342 [Candidatus Kentron sp. LFY]